jgi:hypothetical protein
MPRPFFEIYLISLKLEIINKLDLKYLRENQIFTRNIGYC